MKDLFGCLRGFGSRARRHCLAKHWLERWAASRESRTVRHSSSRCASSRKSCANTDVGREGGREGEKKRKRASVLVVC